MLCRYVGFVTRQNIPVNPPQAQPTAPHDEQTQDVANEEQNDV
jgi:hypothetical protein